MHDAFLITRARAPQASTASGASTAESSRASSPTPRSTRPTPGRSTESPSRSTSSCALRHNPNNKQHHYPPLVSSARLNFVAPRASAPIIATANRYGIVVSFAYSAVMTFLILLPIKYTLGLRVHAKHEKAGMDKSVHGEKIDYHLEPEHLDRVVRIAAADDAGGEADAEGDSSDDDGARGGEAADVVASTVLLRLVVVAISVQGCSHASRQFLASAYSPPPPADMPPTEDRTVRAGHWLSTRLKSERERRSSAAKEVRRSGSGRGGGAGARNGSNGAGNGNGHGNGKQTKVHPGPQDIEPGLPLNGGSTYEAGEA